MDYGLWHYHLILQANIGEVHNQSSMIIYVWQMLPWIFLYAAIRTIRWALQRVSDHVHLRIVHILLMTHSSSPSLRFVDRQRIAWHQRELDEHRLPQARRQSLLPRRHVDVVEI